LRPDCVWVTGDEDWLLEEEIHWEVEEVDRVETVTMDVVPSTIASNNFPMVEEISCPSSDQQILPRLGQTYQVPAPKDRSCYPSSETQIMNPGHRLVMSSNTTFSNDTLRKDIIVMNTFSRDTFSKANSGDEDCQVDKYTGPMADSLHKTNSGNEDEDAQNKSGMCHSLPCSKMSRDSRADWYKGPLADSLDKTNSRDWDENTQTDAELCYILPSYQKMSKNIRADRHQSSLTDILDNKVHNDVALTHKDHWDRDSAEMKAVGEVAKMDIKSVNTNASYDPSWMTKDSGAGIHQHRLADILMNKVHNDVATTHKAPRPRDSVVGTGVEEVAMVDVLTGRTVAPNYLPTVRQLPNIN
jgi:hypothetical protein